MEAWTRSNLLDQWWEPKPYKTRTKTIVFRNGGDWLYAMVSPEGEEHWCRADYSGIMPEKKFSALDDFCDKEGNINKSFPPLLLDKHISASDSATKVSIEIEYKKLEDLEKIIEMGLKKDSLPRWKTWTRCLNRKQISCFIHNNKLFAQGISVIGSD